MKLHFVVNNFNFISYTYYFCKIFNVNNSICIIVLLTGTSIGNESFGNITIIARTNVCKTSFMTAGDKTLKLWRIDLEERKMYGTDVKIGKMKREINCLVINESDEYVYCGTTSGDIIKARLMMILILFLLSLFIKLFKNFLFFHID